jgi:CheY-like chemotaxis protein
LKKRNAYLSIISKSRISKARKVPRQLVKNPDTALDFNLFEFHNKKYFMVAFIPPDGADEVKTLKSEYTILIADRNSHVRDFIKREMIKEGFKVTIAETGKDVINMVFQCFELDLVLLDPDLPDMDEALLLKKIGDRFPPIPVVIHAFDSEKTNYFLYLKQAAFVIKGGQSIEMLKKVVVEVLEAAKL